AEQRRGLGGGDVLEHRLEPGDEVGAEVARVRREESGGQQPSLEEALGDHRRLRPPPAVDRLLADAGVGGDPLDRQVLVAPLGDEPRGRLEDGEARGFAAGGSSSCTGHAQILFRNARRTVAYYESADRADSRKDPHAWPSSSNG